MQDMMYKDFDSFFSEQAEQPSRKIRLYGKEWELPSGVPAKIMLETYRAYKAGAESMSEAKQLEIAFALLGEDNVQAWCDLGLRSDQLAELIKWAVSGVKATGEGSGGKK